MCREKCVLTTDADLAHATTNDQLGMYADLPNYRNNWSGSVSRTKSAPRASFLDAVMAWGDEAAIADRIQAHYDAGRATSASTHRPGDSQQPDWRLLEALSPITWEQTNP